MWGGGAILVQYESLQQNCTPTTRGAIRATRRRAATRRVPDPPLPLPLLLLHLLLRVSHTDAVFQPTWPEGHLRRPPVQRGPPAPTGAPPPHR